MPSQQPVVPPDPLVFEPLLKHRAWGGDRLRRFGKRVPPGIRIGESWELADLPDVIADGQSRVACGPYAGVTLREVLHSSPATAANIMGTASLAPDGGFPLLVKFLDANEHLSVQVHPDAAYTAAFPDAHRKTEAWVVLEAAPGAVLYRGVKESVHREQFFEDLIASDGPGVVPHLNAIAVERGDCIYLPSGICHALGAGIVVAEVQTPSDTTFRVFDWNRNDPIRPLHLEPARRAMQFGADQEDGVAGVVRRANVRPFLTPGLATRPLCRTPVFAIEWIDAAPSSHLDIVSDGGPAVWSLVEGTAQLEGPAGEALRLRTGDTALIPARLEGWSARFPDRATLLRTTLPSPYDQLRA
ncbi:MAG: type I phosphomannose isomerase catalytic subunit [Phycisphaerae bacterium]|nr:type I phosphomannose isomerase catalytic subunit [Phycisphaerae bacterium]